MLRSIAGAALVSALGLALVSTATAQPTAPPPASKDPAAAPAGEYKLDPRHTSIVARVPHMNTISYSNFRFGKSSGTLTWDPAKIESAKVDINVETGSIMTPVDKFAEELTGAGFLNSTAFPTAHFVSTGVKRTGPTSGDIMGAMTFMGQTKPFTIKAEMVGVGKTPRASVVGFTATAKLKRSDFGFTAGLPAIGDTIDLVIDAEFDKAAG